MMTTGWSGGMWGMLGALPMLLWWVFAIFAAVAIAKWFSGSGFGTPRSEEDRALEILRERLARGEIGKKEFDERKHDLG
jgi:putative membrane protein